MALAHNNLLVVVVLLFGIIGFVELGKPKAGKFTADYNFKPKFTRNSIIINRHENLKPGIQLEDISKYAVDDEGDPLLYKLDAAGDDVCTIGQKDGILRLKIRPDREQKQHYVFKVSVSDTFEGGSNRETFLSVHFFVLDVNDNKPIFQNTPYHVDVNEDTPAGTEILSILATDKDSARNGAVRYMFKEGTNYSKFKLHPNSGALTLVGELDYETETSYILEVVAQDQGSQALTEKTKVVVNVKDVDDMKPYFVFNQYEKEINENLPIGSSIAMVSAQDGDKAIKNEINYEIIAGDEYGLFRIDRKNGNVTVKDILDREYYSKFSLKIKAYEVANKASYATIFLHIKLKDVNDNRPKFEKDYYTILLTEDQLNGITIIIRQIKARDEDVTWKNNVIKYWMDDNQYFEVLPESGYIVLRENLKNQNKNHFSFNVFATERETEEHYTAKTRVNIQIERDSYNNPSSSYGPTKIGHTGTAKGLTRTATNKLLVISLLCVFLARYLYP